MAEPEGPEVQSGVLEHIDALRLTLLKTVVTYVVFCIPCWFLSEYLLNYLLAHAVPEGFTIHYFTLLEPFFARIKLMLTVAAMTSLPFTLYYIWQFVAPALHDNEKKFIRPLVASSFLLACAGTAAAYFFLMPCVIAFSQSFSGPNMDAVIGLESFISHRRGVHAQTPSRRDRRHPGPGGIPDPARRGEPDRARAPRLALLRAQHPDLFALQEAGPLRRRSQTRGMTP